MEHGQRMDMEQASRLKEDGKEATAMGGAGVMEETGWMGRPGVMLDPPFPQHGDRFQSLLHTENTYPFVPETLISANCEPGRSSASEMHRGCVLRQERLLSSELLTGRGERQTTDDIKVQAWPAQF